MLSVRYSTKFKKDFNWNSCGSIQNVDYCSRTITDLLLFFAPLSVRGGLFHHQITSGMLSLSDASSTENI